MEAKTEAVVHAAWIKGPVLSYTICYHFLHSHQAVRYSWTEAPQRKLQPTYFSTFVTRLQNSSAAAVGDGENFELSLPLWLKLNANMESNSSKFDLDEDSIK